MLHKHKTFDEKTLPHNSLILLLGQDETTESRLTEQILYLVKHLVEREKYIIRPTTTNIKEFVRMLRANIRLGFVIRAPFLAAPLLGRAQLTLETYSLIVWMR